MSVDNTLAVTIGSPPDIMQVGTMQVGAAARFYRVFVRDLVVPFSIGIYDREKRSPQRVRINVNLKVQESAAPLQDDIRNVLSYETVVEGVKDLAGSGHVNLAETLADRIADLCLRDARVVEARIRVEKLDIFAEAVSVGVEIERQRSSAGPNVYSLHGRDGV